ncbi:MAG: aldo/keto reductase [Armatimonadetes bacterium]|nr:aldo/keto reductase [Armatimonadota bacterium]
MNTQEIGGSGLVTTRLSYGCMRIAGTWTPADITPEMRERGRRAVIAAYEAGYTLFDHADIYCRGECEAIHGEVMRDIPSMRSQILIATKCGIRFPGEPSPESPHRFDFSAGHILASCEGSLKRLGIETIDIYQLHRPDFLMNPEEVAGAFEKLHSAGKVRFFGVSNFYPSQLRALQAHLDSPLIVNQVEIHLGRLDCFHDGTLDQCLELGITPLSWSPLGGGVFGSGSDLRADHPRHKVLADVRQALDEIAQKLGVSRTVVALAWLLKHPSRIVPIVGSVKPESIADAAKADSLDLDREDWYRLLVAARGEPLP